MAPGSSVFPSRRVRGRGIADRTPHLSLGRGSPNRQCARTTTSARGNTNGDLVETTIGQVVGRHAPRPGLRSAPRGRESRHAGRASAVDEGGVLRAARPGRRADRAEHHAAPRPRVPRRAADRADDAVLPVPARRREGRSRRSRSRRSPGGSSARTSTATAGEPLLRALGQRRLRRAAAARSLTAAALARVLRRDRRSGTSSRDDAERLSEGRWPLLAPVAAHLRAAGVRRARRCCSRSAGALVRDWLAEVEDYAAATFARAFRRPARPRRRPARVSRRPTTARRAVSSGSSSSRARLRSPPDPRRTARSRGPSCHSTSRRREVETQLDTQPSGRPGLPQPARPGAVAARPADRARRARLGDRPAVPADAAAPAPPGLLVALRRAAAARRRGRGVLRARRRAAARRRSRGSDGWSRDAEIVHWLFATGPALLGLIMLAEAIVGPEVWRAAPLARLPLAGDRVRARRPDVARDDLLHQLGDPHARAQRLGAGADGDGRGRARPRAAASCTAAGGSSRRRSRSRVSGTAFLVHEQNAWFFARSAFLHHLLGWTLVSARSFPLGLVFRPRSLVLQSGFGVVRDRARGDALLRPRRRAGLRPPLAARGGAAPMRRLVLVGLAASRSCAPAAAWAHATLTADVARVRSSELERLADDGQAALRPVRRASRRSQVLDASGRNYAGTARGERAERRSRRCAALPKGAYTVRWHALSADSHVVSGVWTFGVRVKAPPPTEAYGASGPTRTEHVVRWLYFVALALADRLARVPPALPARARRSRRGVEKRLVRRHRRSASSAALELGILAFCLRCEDVLQLPFGKFLYGDLSPIPTGRASARRSSR